MFVLNLKGIAADANAADARGLAPLSSAQLGHGDGESSQKAFVVTAPVGVGAVISRNA